MANKSKWNKVHFFMRKKSSGKVGHPVYVYGKNKRAYKYLTFTHKPVEGKENDFEELKYNIDPLESDITKKSFVKKKFEVNRYDSFVAPSKNYRIHSEDSSTIKKYKK